MKSMISEQNLESSVNECLRNCKQTSKLLLINSQLTKKSMTVNLTVYNFY